MSQYLEAAHCSLNEPLVVVPEKLFLLKRISAFGVDFELWNLADLFMSKQQHCTLTKVENVKKHNRTPLKFRHGTKMKKLIIIIECIDLNIVQSCTYVMPKTA